MVAGGQDHLPAKVESITYMEATITQVMESWPLQLVLETESDEMYVMLADDVSITRGDTKVDPGVLRPGQNVSVVLRPNTREAVTIVIID